MTIIPRSVVQWEPLQSLLGYKEQERDDAFRIAAAITAACERYCHRKFLRDTYTEYHDGHNDNKVRTKNSPIYEITSLQYAPTWDFSTEREVDTDRYFANLSDGMIYLKFYLPKMDKAVRIEYEAGWTVPTFIGATPESPSDGDVWLQTDGTISQYDTDAWVAYDTELVPENVTLAVIEYITWSKGRVKRRDVGVKMKDRGYTYEGSSVDYETIMPGHVRELLDKEVRY